MYGHVMLLGPDRREIWRSQDLLESIIRNEPEFSKQAGFVVINDGNGLISELKPLLSQFKEFEVAPNPLWGRSRIVFDRHLAGVLMGLRLVSQISSLEFAIKVDTDAFCIGPYSRRVAEFFSKNPDIGIAGTYLRWPDGPSREMDFLDWGARIERVHYKPLWKNIIIGLMEGDARAIRRHAIRRRLFAAAIQNGYRYGHHVQGGAYAVSRALLKKWGRLALLNDAALFKRSYIGEDSMVSMMAKAVGMGLGNFNGEGDVFGVWFSRPPLEPAVLRRLGYSLIHSVKDKDEEIERGMRRAFQECNR